MEMPEEIKKKFANGNTINNTTNNIRRNDTELPRRVEVEIDENEIAQVIYKLFNKTRSKVIGLYGFKFGKDSQDFKYIRSEISKLFHNQFIFTFRTMMNSKLIDRCECNGKLKDFPSECKACKGVGFVNSKNVNLTNQEKKEE